MVPARAMATSSPSPSGFSYGGRYGTQAPKRRGPYRQQTIKGPTLNGTWALLLQVLTATAHEHGRIWDPLDPDAFPGTGPDRPDHHPDAGSPSQHSERKCTVASELPGLVQVQLELPD